MARVTPAATARPSQCSTSSPCSCSAARRLLGAEARSIESRWRASLALAMGLTGGNGCHQARFRCDRWQADAPARFSAALRRMLLGMTPPKLEPSDLAELSIFPLPNVTLFPGAALPLHVFEPRYRELTSDALAGRRIMAV